MNYTDAKEFLRIADMAYDAGDYQNAADARFTDCPDEAIWEEASALGDMFR